MKLSVNQTAKPQSSEDLTQANENQTPTTQILGGSKSKRLYVVLGCLVLCVTLGVYYLFVISLYHKSEVSEAYKLYYLDKKNHFYNRYQDLRVITNRIYDTTHERPFFVSREGFSYPDYNGKGMPFSEHGGFYFMLHNPDLSLKRCLFMRFKPEAEKLANVTQGENVPAKAQGLTASESIKMAEAIGALTLTGANGQKMVHGFTDDVESVEFSLNEVEPIIYKETESGFIYHLKLSTNRQINIQELGFTDCSIKASKF